MAKKADRGAVACAWLVRRALLSTERITPPTNRSPSPPTEKKLDISRPAVTASGGGSSSYPYAHHGGDGERAQQQSDCCCSMPL